MRDRLQRDRDRDVIERALPASTGRRAEGPSAWESAEGPPEERQQERLRETHLDLNALASVGRAALARLELAGRRLNGVLLPLAGQVIEEVHPQAVRELVLNVGPAKLLLDLRLLSGRQADVAVTREGKRRRVLSASVVQKTSKREGTLAKRWYVRFRPESNR